MEKIFKDKVALVTGAASGIGKASALYFAEHGAKVLVSDHNPEGEQVAREIVQNGAQAIFQKCDVSNAEQVKEMIQTCVENFGRIDIAYNNAGVEGHSGKIHELSEEEWDQVIDVNLKGVWLCMKYEIPEMLKTGGGNIVNCSSVAGKIGMSGIAPYVASKHGVIALTKTAALEYAQSNIRVNAVCPGVIQTPMVDRYIHGDKEAASELMASEPIGRFGKPEEVAQTVGWLCSRESSFITGDAVNIDGGWLAH